MTDSFLLRS